MNDLDLVTDLTPQCPLPEPADLAGARTRLTATIDAERTGVRTRTRRSWRVRPSKRLALTTAVVAAAAAAAALIVVPGHSPSAPPTLQRPEASPSARAEAGAPTGVKLAAAQFFRKAATVTGREPVTVPGPDQFVYTETEESNGVASRQWLSAEGNKAGLVENAGQRPFRTPPCTPAQAQVARKPPPGLTVAGGYHCTEVAGYLPFMPTDPHKLLAYLVKVGIANALPQPGSPQASTPGWFANDLGKCVDYLMQTTYLLPAQRAALFRLMAQTPGFTVVSGAPDAVGRIGVAVRWTFEGAPAEIILNAVSYAYMGDRTWPEPGIKDNGYSGAALVKIAFVNRAGQLP
jgi:hypothetical protein